MKKGKKGIILIGISLMTMFALAGCGKKKINLNDYVQVTFSGYNKAGNAELNNVGIAPEIILDNWEVFGLTETEKREGDYIGTPEAYAFLDNISYSVDKKTGLSNGDTVTVEWTVYENNIAAVEEELNVKFAYSDMEVTVEGLEDAQPWDAFDNLNISYVGYAPYALPEIEKASESVEGLIYYVDDGSGASPELPKPYNKWEDGYSNGDVIKIALYAPDNQDVTEYCMAQGKIPMTLSKEYVVEGVSGYVRDTTEISDEIMNSMAKQGEDALRAYIARSWDNPENLTDITLIGNYFLTTKHKTYTSTENEIYLIYKINAINPDPEVPVEFYCYVSWEDIIYQPDGTCSVDLNDYTTTEFAIDATFSVGRYRYNGYESLETLFNKCIVKKADSYEYASSIEQ